jgi:hypothetical protein
MAALLFQGFVRVAVLVLPPSLAIAQSADRPDVKVGDQWKFAVYYTVPSAVPNRTWRITAVTPNGFEGTDNGEPLRLTSELNVLDSPREGSSNPQWLSFPLTVGKRWRFDNDWLFKAKGSRGKMAVDVTVTAFERIAVPAGTFDAFKLTSTAALRGTSPIGSQYGGTTTSTYWYAPAARAVVKSVVQNPYLGPSTVELVEFELRP